MADGMLISNPKESDSQNGVQDLALATQTLSENFDCDWYIRVKVQFYGITQWDHVKRFAEVENKVVALWQNLKSKLTSHDIHLWPQRLVDDAESPNEKLYTCYWLIGLPSIPSPDLSTSKKLLKEWQEAARNEDAPKTAVKKIVQAKFIPRKVFLEQDLKEDKNQWLGSAVEQKAPKSEGKGGRQARYPQSGESFKKVPGSNPKQVREQFMKHVMGDDSNPAGEGKGKRGGKLRPVKDVLNRLKYDGNYNLDEYVVGYLDRKAGILEKPVSEWGDYEDDEIVAYFKHVPDDLAVWDRASKVDLIFSVKPGLIDTTWSLA